MTQTISVVALAAVLAACGSDDSTSTTTTPTPTDTAGTSGGGDSTGSADAGSSGGDANGSTGGGGDAGASSGGAVDAGPAKPKKCAPMDNVCIEACNAKSCGKETAACTTDPKCTGYVQCLAGCQQGQQPPGDAKGDTCPEKCANIAGKAATDLAAKAQLCTLENCIEVKKCAQNDNQCLQLCAGAKCSAELLNANSDPNAAKLTTCLSDCQKGTDPAWPPKDHKPDVALLPNGVTPTTCSGKCYNSFPIKTVGNLMASQFCMLSQCIMHQYTAPCPQTNNACVAACRYDKCGNNLLACTGEAGCRDFFACTQVKSCSNQACFGECQQWIMSKHGAADANSASQTFSSIIGCLQSQCLGAG